MNSTDIELLLSTHHIRPTANRILIVQAMARNGGVFTLAQLAQEIGSIDKSVIFRTLTLFKDNHLVHVVEGAGEGVRYELCTSHDHDVDDDTHVHFYCERCGRTICLTDIPIPMVDLPEGYHRRISNYVIKGQCPTCHSRNKK